MHNAGDLAIEGSVASLVFAGLAAVHPNIGPIVGCADVQEHPLPCLLLIREISLVPNWALIEKQRIALGVPVAGHTQCRRFLEVVFQWPSALTLRVPKVAVVAELIVKSVKSGCIGIDDCVPVAIETRCPTMVDVDDQRRGMFFGRSVRRHCHRNHENQKDCLGDPHRLMWTSRLILNAGCSDSYLRCLRQCGLNVTLLQFARKQGTAKLADCPPERNAISSRRIKR